MQLAPALRAAVHSLPATVPPVSYQRTALCTLCKGELELAVYAALPTCSPSQRLDSQVAAPQQRCKH